MRSATSTSSGCMSVKVIPSSSWRRMASSTAGLGVAEQHRPERHRLVEVLVAVDVPHVGALAALRGRSACAPRTNWVGLFESVWVPSGMTARSARSDQRLGRASTRLTAGPRRAASSITRSCSASVSSGYSGSDSSRRRPPRRREVGRSRPSVGVAAGGGGSARSAPARRCRRARSASYTSSPVGDPHREQVVAVAPARRGVRRQRRPAGRPSASS